MGKEELHFATYFSTKQTTENGKEVLRLAFCGVLRRNKHTLRICGVRALQYPQNPWFVFICRDVGRLKIEDWFIVIKYKNAT